METLPIKFNNNEDLIKSYLNRWICYSLYLRVIINVFDFFIFSDYITILPVIGTEITGSIFPIFSILCRDIDFRSAEPHQRFSPVPENLCEASPLRPRSVSDSRQPYSPPDDPDCGTW